MNGMNGLNIYLYFMHTAELAFAEQRCTEVSIGDTEDVALVYPINEGSIGKYCFALSIACADISRFVRLSLFSVDSSFEMGKWMGAT
jgi:hypothetical protein